MTVKKLILFVFLSFGLLAFTKYEEVISPAEISSKKDITLTLSYHAVSCSCAKWSETRFADQSEQKEYIYLERGDLELLNADDLWDGEHLPLQIEVTGTFVSKKGYPKDFNAGKENPEPAKVFRYNKIRVIKNGN